VEVPSDPDVESTVAYEKDFSNLTPVRKMMTETPELPDLPPLEEEQTPQVERNPEVVHLMEVASRFNLHRPWARSAAMSEALKWSHVLPHVQQAHRQIQKDLLSDYDYVHRHLRRIEQHTRMPYSQNRKLRMLAVTAGWAAWDLIQ
jgi:hypothetical protein